MELPTQIQSPSGVTLFVQEPDKEEIQEAKTKYEEKLRRIEEEKKRLEEKRKKERQAKVESLRQYLINYGSPMAPHAESVITVCETYGSHYCKFFMSIAGVESGLGRVCPPHNAWGWGKASYPSWEYSIPHVARQIANNYYYNGYDTFEKLAYSPYGPHNPEKWIQNLYYFYNSMPNL